MALLRNRRLAGWIRDTALDYDGGRWRLTLRYERPQVIWWWFAGGERAARQRAEAMRNIRDRRY